MNPLLVLILVAPVLLAAGSAGADEKPPASAAAAPLPPVAAPADVAAAPADARKLSSGLAWKVLRAGSGSKRARPADVIEINYVGWTAAGQMFDNSARLARPARLLLSSAIHGWRQGIPLMVVGEKARFWVPADLAYGDKPVRAGAPAGALVYEIELVSIAPPKYARPAPITAVDRAPPPGLDPRDILFPLPGLALPPPS